MKKVTIKDKTFRIMISHDGILRIIDNVAAQVNAYYRDHEQAPLLLCTMTGALPFTAELIKRLDFDAELTSIKVSSYSGTQSTGKVQLLQAPAISLEDRDVLVIEDIVDTGTTVHALRSTLAAMGANEVRVATMLFKPDKFRETEMINGPMIDPEFVGEEIMNDFIVGFGLDYYELGRGLEDIYVLDE